ncbi:MAG: protease complex subunit PrcB family protein [Elusimicrobiota bacterium]
MKTTLLLALLLASSSAPVRAAQCDWEKLTGQDAGIKEKQMLVVRDQQAWEALWAKHDAGRKVARPAVDFSRDIVVAVYLGEKTIGGYKVDLELLADPLEPASRLVVFYREVAPARKFFHIEVISRPYALLRVKKVATVVFEADQRMRIPESQGFVNTHPVGRVQAFPAVQTLQALQAVEPFAGR